jgi:hypothetical protein
MLLNFHGAASSLRRNVPQVCNLLYRSFSNCMASDFALPDYCFTATLHSIPGTLCEPYGTLVTSAVAK